MVIVVINEQHSLFAEQEQILKKEFSTWDTLHVPKSGWNRAKMDEIIKTLKGIIVFASPISYMIKNLSKDAALNFASGEAWRNGGYVEMGNSLVTDVYVFCNDTKEKKELSNGKIVSIVSDTGWYLA